MFCSKKYLNLFIALDDDHWKPFKTAMQALIDGMKILV